MTATTTPAAGTRALVEGVIDRWPHLREVLDHDQAVVHAGRWAASAAPGSVVSALDVASVLCRPDGGASLRYRVRLQPPASERTLMVDVPRPGVAPLVAAFPADASLPTLARAVDPQHMREVLGRVVPGTGGDRAVGRCSVEVVRHSRRGRCVLRYRLRPGAGGPGELRHPEVFGKVFGEPEPARTAAATLRRLRAQLPALADGRRVRVPEPMAVVASLNVVLTEAVPGRPRIAELARRAGERDGPGRAGLADAVRTAALLVAAVHRSGNGGEDLPVRSFHRERDAAEREVSALEPVWPQLSARLRRGLDRAVTRASSDPADARPQDLVVSHGDCTPGQVLIDDAGAVAIVDVDTVRLAEPAADLGRFLGYLQIAVLRRSPGAGPVLTELGDIFLDTYLAALRETGGEGPVRPTGHPGSLLPRTAAYRALTLARAAAHACWQLKDDRCVTALDLLEAEDA